MNQVLFLYFHFSCAETMLKEMHQGEIKDNAERDANPDAYRDGNWDANLNCANWNANQDAYRDANQDDSREANQDAILKKAIK